MHSDICYFQTAGVIIKVYTYSYRSNRYFIKEQYKDGAFYQVTARFLRERLPGAFSCIKEQLGTRKYMGV